MAEKSYADQAWYMYASIPVVAGIVGFVTNWLAIKMTFLPIGEPPVCW